MRLTRELARSNSYAAGEELVTGFRVPSDMPLLEIRALVEPELHPALILLSSIATSTYTVLYKSSRCKSYYNDKLSMISVSEFVWHFYRIIRQGQSNMR